MRTHSILEHILYESAIEEGTCCIARPENTIRTKKEQNKNTIEEGTYCIARPENTFYTRTRSTLEHILYEESTCCDATQVLGKNSRKSVP